MALSTRVYARIHFLVALPPVPDLLLFAKHLFIAAIADGDAARLAATNKCLAQSNKSDAGGKATKKRNRQWTAS